MNWKLSLIALIGCVYAQSEFYSVRVTGKLMCHEKPAKYIRFDIYDESNMLLYEDYNSKFTDKEGHFDITAYRKTDQRMEPYIVFSHKCWEHTDMSHACPRKIVIKIDESKISAGKEPEESKILNLGEIELRYKHLNEVRVKCPIG